MSRRARDSGSVYPAGNRWRATIHDASGKRVYFSAETKKEVTAKLREAERAIEAGRPIRSDQLLVKAFAAQWLEAVKLTIAPRTYRSYSDTLRLHVLPTLGGIPLSRLSAAQVQRLITTQIAAGRSPSGVAYTRTVLRIALAKAEKWGMVTRNVARLVDTPKVRRPEIRPLTQSEAARLLKSVQGQDRTLYLLTIGIGCRRGEGLGLRWQDVDFENGTVTIAHTLQRLDGKTVLAEPKTAESRRTWPLPAPVLASLREHRKSQLVERLAAGEHWQDQDFVFCSAIGTPLDGSAVMHRFQRQLAAAGLPHQRFHDLRHGAASYSLAAGVPLRVVQKMLGHSQISTTADIYAHVLPELQRDAADRMGNLLSEMDRDIEHQDKKETGS